MFNIAKNQKYYTSEFKQQIVYPYNTGGTSIPFGYCTAVFQQTLCETFRIQHKRFPTAVYSLPDIYIQQNICRFSCKTVKPVKTSRVTGRCTGFLGHWRNV